eukprot:366538-Chlamydomonas_euryale.AAC.13
MLGHQEAMSRLSLTVDNFYWGKHGRYGRLDTRVQTQSSQSSQVLAEACRLSQSSHEAPVQTRVSRWAETRSNNSIPNQPPGGLAETRPNNSIPNQPPGRLADTRSKHSIPNQPPGRLAETRSKH